MLQQCLPFTVLKQGIYNNCALTLCVATVLTVYGIETRQKLFFFTRCIRYSVATVLTVYGIETTLWMHSYCIHRICQLQQHLPFMVCAEGCETAEEQSDDEVRTSQVPERREGKTKMMKQQHLPFTVYAEGCETAEEQSDDEVRTSLT